MSSSQLSTSIFSSLDPFIVCLLPGATGRQAWLQRDESLLEQVYVLRGCQAKTEGSISLDINADDLASYLSDIQQQHSQSPILLIREDIELPEYWLQRIQMVAEASDDNSVITSLGCNDPRLNPLPQDQIASQQVDAMVYLLADGWFVDQYWPKDLAWITPEAQACLIKYDANVKTAADILNLEDQQIAVCANLLLESEATAPAQPLAVLGRIKQGLSRWKDYRGSSLPLAGLDEKPVLLHLSHNWGGGIDRWIEDFCLTDKDHHHFILEARATSDSIEENLALYLWTENGRHEINSWCLQPAIEASAIEHPQYKQILEQIISAFQVDQLIVSSLIGHSLDALSTNTPCLQVIHDFYPLWPFLTENPYLFTDANDQFDFARAWDSLNDKRGVTLPGKHSLAYWVKLRESYLALLSKSQVLRIAPSQAAIDLLKLLDENGSGEVQQIAHGIDTQLLAPLAMTNRTEKLRLLVPGRIHPGKGKQLLLDALPQLSQIADIYLLGSGKDGEDFFGISGVHVIYQYQKDELATEVAKIAPDAALLLSSVPETWSYTFSEMSALGIPLIATDLGAFKERLNEGENGWLIQADAESLISRITTLAEKRDLLTAVAQKLHQQSATTLEEMLENYRPFLVNARQLEARSPSTQISVAELQNDFQAMNTNRLMESIQTLKEQAKLSKTELQKRANWADGINAELDLSNKSLSNKTREYDHLQQQTSTEITRINEELIERTDCAHAEITRINQELVERTDWAQTEISNRQIELENWQERAHNWEDLHKQKAETLSQVLGSRSWKLTKPLRATSRLGRNLVDMQIYNPTRWPYIFKRLRQSLAIRGLSGTFQRVQHHKETAAQPDTPTEIGTATSLKITSEIDNKPAIHSLTFSREEQPEVSIIIPLYNQYAYTQACLLSLQKATNQTLFEIILVDDCSTDKTPELLQSCNGVTTLRNAENLGFIGSCNHGAEHARGKYLLFLNNDTEVTDYWLDRLVATYTEFPKAGIVGSRLVYPDGSLQESGGIIFSDASGWNYGRNGNADDPRYQFAREVDYVSGAALMIPASLFAEFGGFDNHYAPAYYEDTDLAFKCRKAGYQVLVQPRSTVIHIEGISSGTDLNQGMKKYQLVNHKKFQQRWADQLKLQPAPITDPDDSSTVRAAAEHYRQKKLLLIDACTPQPDQDSGSVRIINLMRIYRDLGYQVSFFPDNRQWDGKYSQALQSLGVEVLYGEWIKNLPEFFSQQGKTFDTVIVSRHYVAENYLGLIKEYMPQAKFIFDTVDLHYLREQRQAELEQDPALHRAAARSRRAELKIINQADTTLVVSPFEKSILANDAPQARIDVVSNIHPLHGCRKSFSERQNIFFIGGYQHPPNVDSAIWLAKEIWPLIHKQLPGVNCFLLGSKAPKVVQELSGDGLIFRGFVEVLEPWLDNCRIALAPLRYGAGVKGKVNMSMSFGQPVVASNIAVEGMYAENGREVLVADDAETFAAEVVRLYQDEALWNKLSENGLKNVEKHFSFAAAQKNIVSMMAALDEEFTSP
ncbi:MAG: glycosyltransferase [Xanthomonadales bacterium]|nr:glycosyltransferase [Xanthomonadales bacterium]